MIHFSFEFFFLFKEHCAICLLLSRTHIHMGKLRLHYRQTRLTLLVSSRRTEMKFAVFRSSVDGTGIAEWMCHKERRAPAAAPVAVNKDNSIVIMEQINRFKNMIKVHCRYPRDNVSRSDSKSRRRAGQGACSTRTRALYHSCKSGRSSKRSLSSMAYQTTTIIHEYPHRSEQIDNQDPLNEATATNSADSANSKRQGCVGMALSG